MKNTLISIGLGALLALAGCGDEAEQQAQAEAQASEIANQLQEAMNQAAEQAAAPAPTEAPAANPTPAAGGGESNFGTITLATGFMPDPQTASGTSGGPTAANTLDPNCNGYVTGGTPDHILVAQTAFSNLRVMARSDADTTLVIQKPDGSYVCNDDSSEGFNPLIAAEFPAGTYKIWVGSYEQGTNSPYTLGVSELASVTPASLGN